MSLNSLCFLEGFEVNGTSSSFVETEQRPKQMFIHSKMLQLQQKCDIYEKEINRLTTKLRKVNGEVTTVCSCKSFDQYSY